MKSTTPPQLPATARIHPQFSPPSECCWFDSNAVQFPGRVITSDIDRQDLQDYAGFQRLLILFIL